MNAAPSTEDWVVYGSRPRYAHDLAEIIRRRGERLIAAIDNLEDGPEPSPPLPVMGHGALADLDRSLAVALAAGPPEIRRSLEAAARADGFAHFPALVDPTAVVSSTALLAEGVTVNALAAVASHSRLGRFVQVNRSASVGHDVTLHDYVTIGPGAVLTGFVKVGEGSFVGAGAVLRPRVRIGASSTVGAGAVVTRDVPDGVTVVGNPARPLTEGSGR